MSEGNFILRPKTDSKAVPKSAVTAYYMEGKGSKGTKERKNIGAYKDERWLNTFQTKGVPEFSLMKYKQFELRKEDGELWTQKDAEAACKELKLRHEKGPHKGEIIIDTNIRDQADPFFNHSWWRTRKAFEGEMMLSSTEIGLGPIVDAIRGSESVSTARKGEATSGKIREILTSPAADAQFAAGQVDEEMDVYDLFKSQSPAKRRMVFRALGNFDEGVEDDAIKKDLFSRYVKDDATYEEGLTRQQLFKAVSSLPPQELLIRDLTITGIKKGVIRQRSGVFEFAGGAVGTNITSVFEFFGLGNNSQQLRNLHMAVKGTDLSISEQAVTKLSDEPPIE